MSVFEYLCSCIPVSTDIIKSGVSKVMNVLGSTQINQQILDQERCVEDYEERADPTLSVYDINKSKAYKPLQHQNCSNDHFDKAESSTQKTMVQSTAVDITNNEKNPAVTRIERYMRSGKYQLEIFKKFIYNNPEDQGFEKLYNGEDNNGLDIYYKQQLNTESKRLNVFTFIYELPLSLEEYLRKFNESSLVSLDSNIKSHSVIQKLADNLSIEYTEFKKVLIVMPRDFVYIRYTEQIENEYFVVSTSVENEKAVKSAEQSVRGKIILSGTRVRQVEGKVQVQSYLEVDLNLNINPLMIKQPTIREIKKYVERIIGHASQGKSEEESNIPIVDGI